MGFPSKFSNRLVKLSLVIAVVACILLVILWKQYAASDNTKVAFQTAEVSRGDIENLVTATGILQPFDYVDVGAQVSGQLKVLHVDVGSEVKQGDLLAEIDATVYAANVESTRAQLAGQQAQLRDREAQLKLSQINFKRQTNLYKEDATTLETLQSAETSLESSKAQIDQLKAQIQQTESNLRAQEANLDYANIYAPMDGTVVSITSRQGQTLNANQQAPTIMRIADLTTMTVQTQVSEADIGKLTLNMPVYFTILGSQKHRWHSTLTRIQPTPEVLNNVVLYNALFDVPNDQRVLMTQMSAQVFFITSQARNVLTVPISALIYEQEKPRLKSEKIREDSTAADEEKSTTVENTANEKLARTPRVEGGNRRGPRSMSSSDITTERQAVIKVINEKGIPEERSVVVGVTSRVLAEIKSGVKEGDKIVVNTAVAPVTANASRNNRSMGGMRMLR